MKNVQEHYDCVRKQKLWLKTYHAKPFKAGVVFCFVYFYNGKRKNGTMFWTKYLSSN